MVEFGSGYVMSMDRDYGESRVEDSSTNDVGIAPIRDIGFSVPLGIAAPNVQGVAAKIRTGTRRIELQFPGAGRAQRGAQTPGIYGEMQRTALEELGRANKVDFSTHASFSVMGLAGMDQQGNFSKQSKKFAVDEIKRAIEFAADVARGGNVTIHTGEFQRPISEEPWARDENGKIMFKSYEDEPERAVIRVVDERSGQIVSQVRKNQKVARPLWNVATSGESYYDSSGNEHTVEEGDHVFINYDRVAVQSMEDRVPAHDKKSGRFKVEYWEWDRFIEEAKDRTKEAREFWQKNKGNPDAWDQSIYWQFRNAKSEDEIVVDPEEAYVQATLETNAANAKGWALYYGGSFGSNLEEVQKLEKAMKIYEKIEAGVSKDEEWKLKQALPQQLQGIIPPDYKKPTEHIAKRIQELSFHMEQAREAATSQQQQAADAYETMRHVVSQKKYALEESYDAYAQAGMSAMVHSNKLEKEGKLKTPIFVAMEHIFPESYGGHPDELIDLVSGARRSMTEKLTSQGYSASEAKKAAETHIKGHLDTGHFNIWRKYWVWDDKLSPENNEKKFDSWLLGKIETMAEKDMIGSVHLTDNYGYQDEHLSPGQGNTPVVDMIKVLKKHGYKGPMVVEPGADASTDLSDFHGLMKTWRLFGSSIYGVGVGGSEPSRQRAWSGVQYGYFGQGHPPYFVFGRYSPSEDWTLWSGVPME
jgi:hypothetical protein